jgi:hypothetical protein
MQLYNTLQLTAYYNKYFGQCSKAFIRLESMDELTPEEREKVRRTSPYVVHRLTSYIALRRTSPYVVHRLSFVVVVVC